MYAMKRSIYKTLFCAGLLSVSAGLPLTSCEDYLDKARNRRYQKTTLSRTSATSKVS